MTPALLRRLLLVHCLAFGLAGARMTPLAAQAQSSPATAYVLNSIIVDSATFEPIESATIALHIARYPTAFRSTRSARDGSFSFADLPYNAYEIRISAAGHRPLRLELPAGKLQLPSRISLAIHSTELDAIKVRAVKSLLRYDADRLSYQVEQDPDRDALHSLDMLRKLPGINVDGDGNLELNGSSYFQVQLNGRPSPIFARNIEDVLKSLPASSIRSIEIITAPSARQDAEGYSGIINIITHSKIVRGYNVSLRAGWNEPGGPSTGGSLTARAGRVGLSAVWGYNSNDNPPLTNSIYRVDKLNHVLLRQDGQSIGKTNNLFANSEFTWQISEASLFSLHYNRLSYNNNNLYEQEVTLESETGSLLKAYGNSSSSQSSNRGNEYGADLQLGWKKQTGRLLTFSYRESRNDGESENNNGVVPKINSSLTGGRSENSNSFLERTAQADLVLPFKKHSVECGVKYIERFNESQYYMARYDASTGSYAFDPAMSDIYRDQQQVSIGYLSLTLRLGKYFLHTGARYEDQWQWADFVSSGSVASGRYQNIIPSAHIGRRFGMNSNLSVSYTQRLQRPSLYYLNPFVNNNDPYNLYYGNPGLQPVLGHLFTLSFNSTIGKASLYLNLSEQITDGSILRFTTIGSDTVSRTTYGNIGSESTDGGTIGANFRIGKRINTGINSSVYLVRFVTEINSKPQQNQGINYSLSHNAGYSHSGWRFSYNMNYTSASTSLQGKSVGYLTHSITLGKGFLKDKKANISLTVSNPFEPRRDNRSVLDQESFYLERNNIVLMRRCALSFSLRFGKLTANVKEKKRKIVNDDLKTE